LKTNGKIRNNGKNPSSRKSIMPGIRMLEKILPYNNAIGSMILSPEGSFIRVIPPYRAPDASKAA